MFQRDIFSRSEFWQFFFSKSSKCEKSMIVRLSLVIRISYRYKELHTFCKRLPYSGRHTCSAREKESSAREGRYSFVTPARKPSKRARLISSGGSLCGARCCCCCCSEEELRKGEGVLARSYRNISKVQSIHWDDPFCRWGQTRATKQPCSRSQARYSHWLQPWPVNLRAHFHCFL